jgi:hypothetical protein
MPVHPCFECQRVFRYKKDLENHRILCIQRGKDRVRRQTEKKLEHTKHILELETRIKGLIQQQEALERLIQEKDKTIAHLKTLLDKGTGDRITYNTNVMNMTIIPPEKFLDMCLPYFGKIFSTRFCDRSDTLKEITQETFLSTVEDCITAACKEHRVDPRRLTEENIDRIQKHVHTSLLEFQNHHPSQSGVVAKYLTYVPSICIH